MIQQVSENLPLSSHDLTSFVHQAMNSELVDGRRVLFIIPDATRSMPMPTMFRALHGTLHGRVAKMDYLIALGTHPPMTEDAINKMLGVTPAERAGIYRDIDVFNHDWKNPSMLAHIGDLTEDQLAEISDGLMRETVPVTINKRVLDYDLVCIVGPVFPHEVVGFSGGNKYFFPGVAGEELLNVFHWLGALITNPLSTAQNTRRCARWWTPPLRW